MSYTISLSGRQFNPTEWENQIDALTDEEDGEFPRLGPFMDTLWASMDYDSILDDTVVLVDGSIRGININQSGKTVFLNVRTFASRADWALVFAMAKAASELGAKVEEDADFLATGFSAKAIERACKEWWDLSPWGVSDLVLGGVYILPVAGTPVHLSDLMRAEDFTMAPPGGVSLCLKPKDLHEKADALESRLVQQIKCIGTADDSLGMVVGRGKKQRIVGDWQLRPALVWKNTTHVAFFPDDSPKAKCVEIPLSLLAAELGTDAFDAGGAWVLPGIDRSTPAGRKTLERLTALCVPS